MLNFQALGWPPDAPDSSENGKRLTRYERAEQMFEGDHAKAFADLGARVPDGYQSILYIAVNLPGLLSRKVADLLVGEAPVFRAGDPESDQQKALDVLTTQENDLRILLYEAALAASFRGDLILRARVGQRGRNGDPQVIVEEIPAYSYFVERDPDNVRNVLSESIAWVRPGPDPRQKFLRVETHEPGRIFNTAYRLNEQGKRVGSTVALASLYPNGDAPPEEEETGVPESLLTHIPNFRHGSCLWGISDYDDLRGLFDAVNNRLSKIDAILDKHSDPKLVGVPGMSDPSGIVDVARASYVEADSEIFKYLPRYVTWDAELDAAFRELEQLLLLVCAIGEIAPAALGLNVKDGGSAESGKALRLRYLPMEQKCNRKKLYLDPGIKRVLRVASMLGAEKLGRVALDADPEIVWQDGLPQIYSEAVETETMRVDGGLSSKASAIQRIDQCTAEQAEAELERIRAEQKAAMEMNPDPFGLGGADAEDGENGGRANGKPPRRDDDQEDDDEA